MILTDLANVSHSTPKYWAVRVVLQVFVGLILLRGSHNFVSFAFDTAPEETKSDDKTNP